MKKGFLVLILLAVSLVFLTACGVDKAGKGTEVFEEQTEVVETTADTTLADTTAQSEYCIECLDNCGMNEEGVNIDIEGIEYSIEPIQDSYKNGDVIKIVKKVGTNEDGTQLPADSIGEDSGILYVTIKCPGGCANCIWTPGGGIECM